MRKSPWRYRLKSLALPPLHLPDNPNTTTRAALSSSMSISSSPLRLPTRPEPADPGGAFEVGQRQDVEQLGAGSGSQRVEALA
jgi:hypothetical protein